MSRRAKIESLLNDSPEDVFLNYAYAMELSKEFDVESALQVFAKVREIDSTYVPAYFQEGQLLVQADRIEEAQQILQSGIVVAKQIGDAHALGEMTEYLDSL